MTMLMIVLSIQSARLYNDYYIDVHCVLRNGLTMV